MTVARGIVRAAIAVLAAGIVAHSSPRNAHSVSVAVAITPRADAALDAGHREMSRRRRRTDRRRR